MTFIHENYHVCVVVPTCQPASQPANKQAELPVELILCDAWAVLNILGARVAR